MAGKRSWGTFLIHSLTLIGLAWSAGRFVRIVPAGLCGSDFPVFYAGGQLVGSPDLYSAKAVQDIQTREMACTSDSAIFIRLPYFAALMRPWSMLPFWPSFTLWRVVGMAAAGAFIWLWPAPWKWTALICCWSLPMAYCVSNGQDICLLLLVLALAQRLGQKSDGVEAGLTLSLCAAKFHLFVLLPAVFWKERRKTLYGLLAGGALLLAICFAVQGAGWPGQFLSAALSSRIDPAPLMSFNLRGIAHENLWVEAALAATVLAAGYIVFRYGDLNYRLAYALAGGLLLSHHQTYSDAALLIPATLILAFHPLSYFSKWAAIFLVSPVGSVMIWHSVQAAEVPRLVLLAMAWRMAWEVLPVRKQLDEVLEDAFVKPRD